jgi:hypothetical protein
MAHQDDVVGVSTDSRQPEDFRLIFQAILQTNEKLMEQNRSILALLSKDFKHLAADQNHHEPTTQGNLRPDNDGAHPRPSALSPVERPAPAVNNQIWDDILCANHHESDDFMQTFHCWTRPPSLEAVVNGKRAWTSWCYRAAFPELSAFLQRASLSERCPCQVSMEDFCSSVDEPITMSFSKANNRINNLWEQIKHRPMPPKAVTLKRNVSARLFRIIDLSPIVLACILGSTPQ